jgi:hypothetical protein
MIAVRVPLDDEARRRSLDDEQRRASGIRLDDDSGPVGFPFRRPGRGTIIRPRREHDSSPVRLELEPFARTPRERNRTILRRVDLAFGGVLLEQVYPPRREQAVRRFRIVGQVEGSRLRDSGLGTRDSGSGTRAPGLGLRDSPHPGTSAPWHSESELQAPGSRLRAPGLGPRAPGLGTPRTRAPRHLGTRNQSFRLRAPGLGTRAPGLAAPGHLGTLALGIRASGAGLRESGLGLRDSGSGLRDSGSGLRDS